MYLKSKNAYLILSSFIVIVYFIPFLPRGSFLPIGMQLSFGLFAYLFKFYKIRKI